MLWLVIAMQLSQDLMLMLYDRDRAATARYLETAKGSVEFVLIPDGRPQANAYGNFALGYGSQLHTDLEQPNPAFFHHVDWVVKRASSKGLQVLLVAPGAGSGFSADKRTAFVMYVRKRYERNRRVQVRERGSLAG